MLEAGVLKEDDNVELIDGDIVSMAAISSRHSGCVNRLTQLFTQRIGAHAIVAVQNPIRLDEFSEPEPDLALLFPRNDFYSESHPQPEDILLIVEVADTSIRYDRDVKMQLYASAGIPEVWLVDLTDDVVEVCRSPVSDRYEAVQPVRAGEHISPDAFEDIEIAVEDILP